MTGTSFGRLDTLIRGSIVCSIHTPATMAYKDKDKQREYQKQWVAKRRADFFADKLCTKCDSAKNLELDHIDPALKLSHSIWSWSEKRRLEEIKKCQILCEDCHKEKTAIFIKSEFSGENSYPAKLTNEEALIIRASSNTNKYLAEKFNVSIRTITRVRNFEAYKNI